MSQASTMGSTVLDSRASNSKAITRLLQHSILQLCNEHIGYSHKLQILGVLCMTVDDEQQELVVKVNNTLKRVSPQGPKEAAPPPQVQGMMPGAGYPPPEIQLPHPAVPQSIYNISSPVGSQSNGQQGASGSGQPTPHSTPVAAAAGDASEPAHEAEGSSTPLSTSYSDSPSNGQIASGTGSGNTNKRSHGRKGTKPTKVHHVYDEGEMIDEGDGDILTVIPTDPDNPDEGIQMTPLPPPQPVSVYPDDDDSAEEVSLETPPRRRKPRRFSTPKGPISTASPNVRALLQQSIANRAAAPQGEGNQLRNALLNGAQSTLTMPLCLPTQMPERVASTASSSEPMDMSTSQFNGDLDDEDRESGSLQIDESGNDDIEQARGDSDSFRLNSSVVSVKDEPKDDYNWSQAGQVFNTTNSLNASGLSLANSAALSAFQSGNYAGYTLAPHLDGMASLPNYSGLSLALGSPNYQLPSTSNQQDGLTIRYTPTGPITVGANGKNVSQQKVKDIIMFDDQSPLSQQKGNRLETDYMVDKMGMEGRKRRRRAPDETLTSEEIAEYMGASAGADAQVGKGTFQCKYCTVRVEDLVTYMQHTLAIHNAFICHQCGKSFTTKSSLLRHRPIHTGMRRFACSICKKTFYRKDKCKAHIKRHLGNNGEIASEIIEREIE